MSSSFHTVLYKPREIPFLINLLKFEREYCQVYVEQLITILLFFSSDIGIRHCPVPSVPFLISLIFKRQFPDYILQPVSVFRTPLLFVIVKKKEKRIGDQDFTVDPRNRNQKRKFAKSNATLEEKYFSDRLEIPRNLQSNFNMMSAKFSRELSNQNDNTQRVAIRRMDDYIQSIKDNQTDTDVTFFKLLLELLELHPSI